MTEREFDTLVIGGGTGNKVASAAAAAGDRTALISEGPLGGTCLNDGCNPTKMLIRHADAAAAVREAGRFEVEATLDGVDFGTITREVSEQLGAIADRMEAGKREEEHLTLFRDRAAFLDDRTVAVDGRELDAERVVVAAGSRPVVPPIDGLDEVDYLTSDEAIRLRERPEELVIAGGGYIAVELGYFFEAMGTDVTVVEMLDTLVGREDPAVAEAFTELARARHDVYTGHRVTRVEDAGGRVRVHADPGDGDGDGDAVAVEGDELLLALGRRPNSDTLGLERTSVETDGDGFVRTDSQLRTTAEGVWAQGDVADNYMFKHSADYETEVVIDNVVHDAGREADFTAMPHAIFTDPQIGGVGATEDDLEGTRGADYVVGRTEVADTAMGRAMKAEAGDGFFKLLVGPDGDLLGAHALSEEASVLIHEAVVAMRNGLDVHDLADTVHVHPSLSKVAFRAARDAAAQLD